MAVPKPPKYASANAAEGAVMKATPPKPPKYASAAAAEAGAGYNNQYAPGDVAPGSYGTAWQKTATGWTATNAPTTGQQAAQAATAMAVPKPPAPPVTAPASPRVSNWQQYAPPRVDVPTPTANPTPLPPRTTPTQPASGGVATMPYASASAAEGRINAPNAKYAPGDVVQSPFGGKLMFDGQRWMDVSAATPTSGQMAAQYATALQNNPPATSGGGGGGGTGGSGGYGSTFYENPAFNPAGTAPSGTYVVQPGDNLATIARKLGVDFRELLRLNPMQNPDLIYAGQELILPGGGSTDAFGRQAGNFPAMDPNDPKNWGDTSAWQAVYGGGGNGAVPTPPPADVPSAPAPTAPVPPAPTGPDLGKLLDLFAVVQPGQIFEIPPAWQEELYNAGLGGTFSQLLSSLGFSGIGDMGLFGFNSDYVKPAQVVVSPQTQGIINALPPEWRAAMGQFVLALMGQPAASSGVPVPPTG